MADDSAQIRARVREEILASVPEDDMFDAGALEKRLEKLLAVVKKIPRTAAETESAAKSMRESAATRVFNIYELAEFILENLSIRDIIQAQNITKMARRVLRSSQRVLEHHTIPAAINTTWYDDRIVINKHLDFDLTLAMCPVDDNGGRLHLLGSLACELYNGADAEPLYLFRLNFDRSLEAKPTSQICSDYQHGWDGNEGDILHTRTVIAPYRDDETQSLWRYLKVAKAVGEYRPKKEYDAIEVLLRSECDQGHPMEEVKRFPHTVTLGEVYEWLQERVRERYPADWCPNRVQAGLEDVEHRVQY